MLRHLQVVKKKLKINYVVIWAASEKFPLAEADRCFQEGIEILYSPTFGRLEKYIASNPEQVVIITNESSINECLQLIYEERVSNIILYNPKNPNFFKDKKVKFASGTEELIKVINSIR